MKAIRALNRLFLCVFFAAGNEKKGGSGTLIGRIIGIREDFGPGKAIFWEFRLRSEFGGAGGRIWSIWSSFG